MNDFDKEVALFKEFCRVPALTDEQCEDKLKELLQINIFKAVTGESLDKKSDVKVAIYESLAQFKGWEDETESWERFKEKHSEA